MTKYTEPASAIRLYCSSFRRKIPLQCLYTSKLSDEEAFRTGQLDWSTTGRLVNRWKIFLQRIIRLWTICNKTSTSSVPLDDFLRSRSDRKTYVPIAFTQSIESIPRKQNGGIVVGERFSSFVPHCSWMIGGLFHKTNQTQCLQLAIYSTTHEVIAALMKYKTGPFVKKIKALLWSITIDL